MFVTFIVDLCQTVAGLLAEGLEGRMDEQIVIELDLRVFPELTTVLVDRCKIARSFEDGRRAESIVEVQT